MEHKNPVYLKLIYIIGMGHSGSTLLSLLLSRHSQIVSLGEIEKAANLKREGLDFKAYICSCGKEIPTCPFWGALWSKSNERNMLSSTNSITEQFTKFFPGKILVDSSKSTRGLQNHFDSGFIKSPEEICVVNVVRDFRTWVRSIQQTNIRKRRPRTSAVRLAFNWLKEQTEFERDLQKLGIRSRLVALERLTTETKLELGSVLRFAALAEEDLTKNKPGEHHDCSGNRMRRMFTNNGFAVRPAAKSGSLFWPYVFAPLLAPVWLKHMQFKFGK